MLHGDIIGLAYQSRNDHQVVEEGPRPLPPLVCGQNAKAGGSKLFPGLVKTTATFSHSTEGRGQISLELLDVFHFGIAVRPLLQDLCERLFGDDF